MGSDPSPDGQWVLLEGGQILPRQAKDIVLEHLRYFREVKPQYTFGVLTLEKTGDYRSVEYGEFYELNGEVNPWVLSLTSTYSYRVLKIVKANI